MHIHDRIRALGTEFSGAQVQASMALFGPLQPPVDEAMVRRDLFYGPDPRHRLDLFGELVTDAKRPVLVFLHGGGFVGGDKGAPGAPFYNNVGAWAAAQGWLGMTATYRLAPVHPWPAGAEDVARLVAWLRLEVARHGGDPGRIVLMGQSAGAAHVASYVGGQGFADQAAASIAGAILLSGLYDVPSAARNPYQDAYFGTDPAWFAAQSSIDGLAATSVPCLFTVSENDPADFQRQAALLVSRRVAAKGKWPDFHRLEGHNHISPVHQIHSSVDELGPVLARFVARVTG
ncbi:alpha/beta hydrolase [Niveispirillum sp. KHB5.9]|uniref:alpha/beta hydrolase n=1 Tax=Niveispirillum sp. KHB5.9 TaxID=3400269 RepID=UPI003A87AC6F